MIKKILVTSLLSLAFTPVISQADITIQNNTDFYGTGVLGISPCSSAVGDSGMAKPHSTLTVPQSVLGLYCGITPCDARVYLSKDCSGNPVLTATVDARSGVTSVNNLDPAHFEVTGGGDKLTVTSKATFKNLLRRILG